VTDKIDFKINLPAREDLGDSIKEGLNVLCQSVLGTNINALDETQLRDLLQMDMNISMRDISISATETRKMEVAYCTNAYFVSMTLDCQMIADQVKEELRKEPKETILERYIQLKRMFVGLISQKYETHEQLLRDLIRKAQKKDNVDPLGRFNPN
jgi:hypothetical protein